MAGGRWELGPRARAAGARDNGRGWRRASNVEKAKARIHGAGDWPLSGQARGRDGEMADDGGLRMEAGRGPVPREGPRVRMRSPGLVSAPQASRVRRHGAGGAAGLTRLAPQAPAASPRRQASPRR